MDARSPCLDANVARLVARRETLAVVCGRSLFAVIVLLGGCSSPLALSAVDEESGEPVVRLTFDPESRAQIDVGELDASRRTERHFIVENHCPERVRIAHVKTSCECLTFDGLTAPLDPEEEALAIAVVDLRDDPEFHGSLGVEATGYDARGRVVFAAVVSVRVPLRESVGVAE